jgi:hypothetical protein
MCRKYYTTVQELVGVMKNVWNRIRVGYTTILVQRTVYLLFYCAESEQFILVVQ